MNELACLVQRTADQLAGRHVGAVVAGLAGGAVEIRGAGRTGPGGGVPGPRTLFEVGSVTKVFSSLALARLVLAGAAELDDPVTALLPDGAAVPVRRGQAITLRHLATHTSGLPRLPRGMTAAALLTPHKPDPYAHCTADRILAGLARTRLRAVPGRGFRYSNLGAGLLGLALAHRAGTGYAELVRREVCAPLELADTVVTPDEEQSERLAHGHTARGRAVPYWNFADLGGMGALRSTAADLAIFVRAQLSAGREPDGPLAPAISLTREVRHRVNPFAWVHLGWLAHRLHTQQGGHLQIWHNGGTGGFRSFVAFDPEKQVGVVVLANTRRSPDSPGTALLRTLQNGFATTT
ncbi:beta-lactamase family protein [Streptomyces kaniharaensis]|uniref:Beta-lactamase family protein n=1 Tax=Streptomyces kaniharaensis TaxID=212423 RepID=A0A6N7KM01_9ACTN|nr:serine hydrolase domain-containing protein [Streptomyces kaniharaensis]MQS11174.1 beta-lactamase family protein [Streptomyces kaniharaensis]